MNSTRVDFDRRVNEIEVYFNFLILSDLSPSSINYTEQVSGNALNHVINEDLRKILKANGFILLYNLVESTVNKSLIAIFNKIIDEGRKFSELSDTFRKLWIYDKGSVLKGIDNINLNKIRELMRDIAESVLATEIANLSTNCISISGNLDAQEIRKIAGQLGFDAVPDGRHLLTIKTKRNQLAHGEFSFTDIGQNYSVNQLIEFKSNAITYLREFMNSIELFINVKKYAA